MTAALILMLIYPAFSREEQKPPAIDFGNPMERLTEVADIATDAQFAALLAALNQGEEIKAPAKLRTFMEQFTIGRLKLSTGYVHEEGRVTLLWVVEEMVVAGYREQVSLRLQDALKGIGLTPKPATESGTAATYAGEEGGVAHELILTRSEEQFAGGRPWVMLKFIWKTVDSFPSPLPTLSELTAGFSWLRDRRIDESLYRDLGGLETDFLAFGGANRASYDWCATIIRGSKMKKDDLYKLIRASLEKCGFQQGTVAHGVETYSRKGMPSKAWLQRVGEDQKIKIVLAP